MDIKQQENIHLQDYCDSEAEETLSLSDLPLSSHSNNNNSNNNNDDDDNDGSRRRSDDLRGEDLFEFSSSSFSIDHNSSSAEFMIFGGKLLPYTSSSPSPSNHHHQLNKDHHHQINLRSTRGEFHHRRSESVGDFYTSEKIQQQHLQRSLIRPSRSLDYAKLQRSPTRPSDRGISGAMSCFGGRHWSIPGRRASPAARPRWRLLMFGMMRAPVPEMEIRDIRSRLSRRSPATMFPAAAAGKVSVKMKDGGGGGRGSGSGWRLPRAFGCKGGANAAVANAVVTAPLCCVPHVRI